HISVVRAGLTAIEALYRLDGWDWFFLLSGSDYPIATLDRITRELLSTDFDVLIDIRLIEYDREAIDGPDANGEFSFLRPFWPSLVYDYCLTQNVWHLKIRNRTWLKMLGKWPSFRVYGGDQWLGGNRRTAETLLRHPDQRKILTFFSSKEVSNE